MRIIFPIKEMNATFAKHPGVLLPDGRVIAYTLEFKSPMHAVNFLSSYPVGPSYLAVYDAVHDIVTLVPDETSV